MITYDLKEYWYLFWETWGIIPLLCLIGLFVLITANSDTSHIMSVALLAVMVFWILTLGRKLVEG